MISPPPNTQVLTSSQPLDNLIYTCILLSFLGQGFNLMGHSEALFFDLSSLAMIALKTYQILHYNLFALRKSPQPFTTLKKNALISMPALCIQGVCLILCVHNVTILLTPPRILL
jgi:hypothetical protein